MCLFPCVTLPLSGVEAGGEVPGRSHNQTSVLCSGVCASCLVIETRSVAVLTGLSPALASHSCVLTLSEAGPAAARVGSWEHSRPCTFCQCVLLNSLLVFITVLISFLTWEVIRNELELSGRATPCCWCSIVLFKLVLCVHGMYQDNTEFFLLGKANHQSVI